MMKNWKQKLSKEQYFMHCFFSRIQGLYANDITIILTRSSRGKILSLYLQEEVAAFKKWYAK